MKRLLILVALAGCAAPPTTPTAVRPVEEAGRPVVGTSSTARPQVLAAPRPSPSKASRSRGLVPRGSGPLLDVTCYAETGSRTASGKWPRVGMAASNTYPFGTRLEVDTIGIVTVEDRIGHGTDLDIFGPSEAFCRQFGRKHLHVRRAA